MMPPCFDALTASCSHLPHCLRWPLQADTSLPMLNGYFYRDRGSKYVKVISFMSPADAVTRAI